jgi:uncharacterized damage-inducible protein DinB
MNPSHFFAHWREIRTGLCELLDQFDDADLHYIPFPESWPVGRIFLHIAEAEEGWLRYAVTRELNSWPDGFVLENYPMKAAIAGVLDEVHDRTEAWLDTLDASDLSRAMVAPWGAELRLSWIIWHIVEHEVHHRGELSLLLGLLGRQGLDV